MTVFTNEKITRCPLICTPTSAICSSLQYFFTPEMVRRFGAELWVASEYGLLLKLANHEWVLQTYAGESEVYDVAIDANGCIWAITRNMLYRIDGDNVESYAPDVVGQSRWGDAIGFDSEGNIWVGVGLNYLAVFRG